MLCEMRKLHPRGPANRGLAVDADGASVGPDCPLVVRTMGGCRVIGRSEAGALQRLLLGDLEDPDWLFGQCRRIADSLNRRDIALAQIYGLHIPIPELDDVQLRRLAAAAPLIKAGFDPSEPRVPKGDPRGGQRTSEDDAGGVDSSDGASSPDADAGNGPSDGEGSGGEAPVGSEHNEAGGGITGSGDAEPFDAERDGDIGQQAASSEDVARFIQECQEECIAIYADERPGILPGVGSDMAGRLHRCIRECLQRRGYYSY